MISVFFPSCGETLELAERYAAGDTVDAAISALLHNTLIMRLRSRIAWRLEKGRLAEADVAAEAQRLWLEISFENDDFDLGDDPIDAEAFAIAKELITSQLAKEGLAVPKGIDDHARTLASESEAIRAKAKARVDAKRAVAVAAVQGLGQ